MRTAVQMLLLPLVLAASVYAGQCCWYGVRRVVAVGDVHGDLDGFRKILSAAGLIDGEDRWTGGKTHLVQTGDVLDRGPDSRKVMDLLLSLEKQALEAGGYVHRLLGNHEAMVFGGDLRYVDKGEYLSHGGEEELVLAMGAGGRYGRELVSGNAVILINDILFLHGGVSRGFTGETVQSLNRAVGLAMSGGKRNAPVLGSTGPLWFRGYSELDEYGLWKLVRENYRAFGARIAVAGHTVTGKGILLRCGGRVLQIDTGLSRYYGGPVQFLEVSDGKLRISGL